MLPSYSSRIRSQAFYFKFSWRKRFVMELIFGILLTRTTRGINVRKFSCSEYADPTGDNVTVLCFANSSPSTDEAKSHLQRCFNRITGLDLASDGTIKTRQNRC